MAVETARAMRGCFMTRGLYLKANGELPCWDDVGESKILRKLDPVALAEGRETDLTTFRELRHIRESFAAGALPYSDLCEKCGVRSTGPAPHDTRDDTLQVLHVEPSFMCHLSCPLCIPQKARKSLKNPPYHLTGEMYEGFMKQLKREGIKEIKLIIFEGRGDPLSSPHMDDLVKITRECFPTSSTSITTHGSFPYKPWIATSGLDVMRFSIDGARQESYGRYRVGGNLEKALQFMERLVKEKPKEHSKLYVEWKYILFEWNDSDEELSEAAAMADKLGVQLRFCRTHSEGKSQRFLTYNDVAEMIRRIAPQALQDLTFQLKDENDLSDVDVVRADQIRSLMASARSKMNAGNQTTALALVLEAVKLDLPSTQLRQFCDYSDVEQFILIHAGSLQAPQLIEQLIATFRPFVSRGAISALLERLVELLPTTPDRRQLEIELAVEKALAAHSRGDDACVRSEMQKLLACDYPDANLVALLEPALALRHPGLSVAMANFLERQDEHASAIIMFENYLHLAPGAPDLAMVSSHVADLKHREVLLEVARRSRRASTTRDKKLLSRLRRKIFAQAG